MLFTPKGYINNCYTDLTMNGEKIEFVAEIKFLGLWIDHHLTWKRHIEHLENSLNSFKFVFRKLNRLLPTHCMRQMYYSYIHSRMTYAISAWGTMITKELSLRLEKIQRCFIRLTNCKGFKDDCNPLYLNIKTLKFHDLIKLEMLKIIYDYRTKNMPISVYNLFEKKDHGYNTRNIDAPRVKKHHSTIYNSSFLCQSVLIYDSNKELFLDISTKKGMVRNFKYKCFSMY